MSWCLQESRVFGKRAQKHILILASGDKVRHMTFQPWMAALSVCFISVFSIGYLAATSYLVLRDDLIGGTMARQARMQHEYEDRIAALRAQVDRVTSRQLLDQQVVEDKVEKLLQQQLALTSRHGKLGTLLDRAGEFGYRGRGRRSPLSRARGQRQARRCQRRHQGDRAADGHRRQEPAEQKTGARLCAAICHRRRETTSDRADRLFSKVTLSLKDIEQEQKHSHSDA